MVYITGLPQEERRRRLNEFPESSVQSVNPAGTLQIGGGQLLDDVVPLLRAYLFKFVYVLLDMPQFALDVYKPCENPADVFCNVSNSIPFLLVAFVRGEGQLFRRNPSVDCISEKSSARSRTLRTFEETFSDEL